MASADLGTGIRMLFGGVCWKFFFAMCACSGTGCKENICVWAGEYRKKTPKEDKNKMRREMEEAPPTQQNGNPLSGGYSHLGHRRGYILRSGSSRGNSGLTMKEAGKPTASLPILEKQGTVCSTRRTSSSPILVRSSHNFYDMYTATFSSGGAFYIARDDCYIGVQYCPAFFFHSVEPQADIPRLFLLEWDFIPRYSIRQTRSMNHHFKFKTPCMFGTQHTADLCHRQTDQLEDMFLIS